MKIAALVFITIAVLKLIVSEVCSFKDEVNKEDLDLEEYVVLIWCLIANMIIGTLAIVFSAIALF